MAGSPTRIPVKLHKQVSLIRTTEPFLAEELLARKTLARMVVGRLSDTVLLVHAGLGNRHEMLGRAQWLLEKGYVCLLIDQRGCGTSGGGVSWGVKEPADIAAWANWLRDRTHAKSLYGSGLSRGSTTLLQSLGLHAPFTGLALEATGAGNVAQPYQLVSDETGVS